MKKEIVYARKINGIDRVLDRYTWVCKCPRCDREVIFTISEVEEPKFRCECPFCWNPTRDKSAYSFMVKFL